MMTSVAKTIQKKDTHRYEIFHQIKNPDNVPIVATVAREVYHPGDHQIVVEIRYPISYTLREAVQK